MIRSLDGAVVSLNEVLVVLIERVKFGRSASCSDGRHDFVP